MKSIWFLAFCLSLLADEFPFPPDSKTVSMATDSLGDRIAIWEEKGRILVSEKPINGNWSMPAVLSSALEEATTPQLKIDAKGKVIVNWVEGKRRVVASKLLKGEWVFKDPEDFSFRSEKLNVEKKRKIPSVKKTIQPMANAIDAPTSSVLSGGQIGFAAGTAAPSNGLVVSGKVGIATSSISASDYVEVSPSFTASGGRASVVTMTGSTLTAAASNDEFNMLRMNAPVLATTAGGFTGLLFYGSRILSPTLTGNGTFSNAYGYHANALASVATNQFGGYFTIPTGGTVNTALYSDNASIGYLSPTPPTNGLIVLGPVGMGINTVTARLHLMSPSASTSNQFVFYDTGQIVSTDTAFNAAAAVDCSVSPSNTAAIAASMILFPKFFPSGAITLGAGLYIDAASGTGTATTMYGMYVNQPTLGTTTYAASIQGGMVHKWNGQNAAYTITTGDYYVALTGTGTARTFTLPATPPAAGWTVVVKDEGGGRCNKQPDRWGWWQ